MNASEYSQIHSSYCGAKSGFIVSSAAAPTQRVYSTPPVQSEGKEKIAWFIQ